MKNAKMPFILEERLARFKKKLRIIWTNFEKNMPWPDEYLKKA